MWKRFRNKSQQRGDLSVLPEFLGEPWKAEYPDASTVADIYYCFRLLLGRNPSKEEWAGHSSYLAGKRLRDVVSTYIETPEFKHRQLGSFDIQSIEALDIHEFKLYVPKDDPLVGNVIYQAKTYEPHITNILLENLQAGDYVVDVGANIGYFSMLAASRVGSTGRVFSFEPFDFNVKLLHLSKRINNFAQVEIFPLAASAGRELYLYDNAGTNGFISPLTDDFRTVMQSTVVYAASLDEMLATVPRLDYLKIDVEGAEPLVLQGALNLLRRYHPVIISEFAPPAIQNASHISPIAYLKALLITPEYEIFVLEEGKVVACQQQIEKVMEYFSNRGGSHIDILVTPHPSTGG